MISQPQRGRTQLQSDQLYLRRHVWLAESCAHLLQDLGPHLHCFLPCVSPVGTATIRLAVLDCVSHGTVQVLYVRNVCTDGQNIVLVCCTVITAVTNRFQALAIRTDCAIIPHYSVTSAVDCMDCDIRYGFHIMSHLSMPSTYILNRLRKSLSVEMRSQFRPIIKIAIWK